MRWPPRDWIRLLSAGLISLACAATGARGQILPPAGQAPAKPAGPPAAARVSFTAPLVRPAAPQPEEIAPAIEPLPPLPQPMPLPGGYQGADQRQDAAGAAGTITLEELVQRTMDVNPYIRQAISNVTIARGRALQAGLYPNPQFQAFSPQLAGNQSQYSAQLAQDYVTANKLKLDSDAAWRGARQAELQLLRTRFDVLTALRQQYYITLAAQRRVEVLEELVKVARMSRDTSMKLIQAGEVGRADALMLDIELDRAQVAWENAETLYEVAKRQLSAVVGLPQMNLPRLAGQLEAELPKYDLIAVQRGVIERNALIRIAQIDVGRNEVLLQRARVEPIPNINFQGGYQNQQPGALAPQNQGLFQVTLNIPLFNRNQGNIRAAQASIAAAASQVGRVENDLSSDAAGSIGRFLAAQQLVDRFEEQMIPKANDALRMTRQTYVIGQESYLRLLQAQRQLMEVSLDYVNAQEQRWTAAAAVAGLLQAEQFP